MWFGREKPAEGALTVKSFDEAMQLIRTKPLADTVENVYVIGGSAIYQVMRQIESAVSWLKFDCTLIHRTSTPVAKYSQLRMLLVRPTWYYILLIDSACNEEGLR